jgi:hypothetical protein
MRMLLRPHLERERGADAHVRRSLHHIALLRRRSRRSGRRRSRSRGRSSRSRRSRSRARRSRSWRRRRCAARRRCGQAEACLDDLQRHARRQLSTHRRHSRREDGRLCLRIQRRLAGALPQLEGGHLRELVGHGGGG